MSALLGHCRAGFGGRQLEALMRPHPGEDDTPRYLPMGDMLGGFGQVTEGDIANLQLYANDLANCVLLCREQHPIDCHRHHAITGPHYPKASHIYRDRLFYSADLSRVQAGEIDFPELASGSWEDWLEILATVK